MTTHEFLECRGRGERLAVALGTHTCTCTCACARGVQCTCTLPIPLIGPSKTPATKTVEEAETTVNGLVLQYIAPFSLTEEY